MPWKRRVVYSVVLHKCLMASSFWCVQFGCFQQPIASSMFHLQVVFLWSKWFLYIGFPLICSLILIMFSVPLLFPFDVWRKRVIGGLLAAQVVRFCLIRVIVTFINKLYYWRVVRRRRWLEGGGYDVIGGQCVKLAYHIMMLLGSCVLTVDYLSISPIYWLRP